MQTDYLDLITRNQKKQLLLRFLFLNLLPLSIWFTLSNSLPRHSFSHRISPFTPFLFLAALLLDFAAADSDTNFLIFNLVTDQITLLDAPGSQAHRRPLRDSSPRYRRIWFQRCHQLRLCQQLLRTFAPSIVPGHQPILLTMCRTRLKRRSSGWTQVDPQLRNGLTYCSNGSGVE